MKKKLNYWTQEEIDLLVKLYPTTHNEIISKKLNRTVTALRSKADVLNLKKLTKRIWTEDENKILSELYPHTDDDAIAKQINRTTKSIKSQAARLKLKKNDERLWLETEIDLLIKMYPNCYTKDISDKLKRSEGSITLKAKRLNLKKSTEQRSKHIIKRNKMVGRDLSYEFVKQQALLYKTRSEFQKKDPSSYCTARKSGYLNEICSHMFKISYSIPQLILKKIMDTLLNETCLYNDRKTIKPYELDVFYPKYNLAFEYNGKGWHTNNNNDSIKLKLCFKKNITLIVISENSRNYEKDIKSQISFHLLTINNITGYNINSKNVFDVNIDDVLESIYTKNSLIELAKKYDSYKKFKYENFNAYQKLCKLKLLEQATLHMVDKPIKYTVESVQNTVDKYLYLSDLIKYDRGTYGYIKKHKINHLLDDLIYKRKRKN